MTVCSQLEAQQTSAEKSKCRLLESALRFTLEITESTANKLVEIVENDITNDNTIELVHIK